ncbi:hypothetical protein CDL12_28976 [Handroanthus impetiginosus]|uniref:CLAVATA3/ESR (CLE)-related protein n=1 Tax=Handroanthus impetiginosus TaxID=429701 RepID=A0A2G9G0U5_9LAMI|nr:hypothetical protein CDL12_28976 [Handroanthus impetiginosus]
MASLKLYFCLILILFVFLLAVCESHSSHLSSSVHFERRVLIESTKKILEESLKTMRSNAIAKNRYMFNRFNPGGPDPKHH